ncbi:uncharacterized protein LOC128337123 isoform X2 [Hemicordylus capensis]|uniref:uncharacterized protein LOC128337123 isoform X2 n=1 Tax=Hemicordylus capensis TaxID=884348 RepID=UPI0023035993|nr:uncharacterized protein LOC128337123 isoform X2 [Hemicordylus capensis]
MFPDLRGALFDLRKFRPTNVRSERINFSVHVDEGMLWYGSSKIRKHRTMSKPRTTRRKKTKTKAAFCSKVKAGTGRTALARGGSVLLGLSAILAQSGPRDPLI